MEEANDLLPDRDRKLGFNWILINKARVIKKVWIRYREMGCEWKTVEKKSLGNSK